jgi:hypothetical protein
MKCTVKILLMMLVLLFAGAAADGQVVFVTKPSKAVKIGHFFKNYWIPITASAVLTLAREANAESSIYCQKQPGCNETNSTIGKHPSALATRSYALASAGILDAANMTWWWLTGKYDSKDLRPLMFLWNGPLIIIDAVDTANNIHDAEYLQKHRCDRDQSCRKEVNK